MDKKLTTARLVLAIVSMVIEQGAIYVIWRWLLPEFGINLSVSVLIGVMAAWAVFGIWLFLFTTHTLRRQVPVGLPSMVGTKGKVSSRLVPEGLVRIKGELWVATSPEGDIDAGENIVVVGEDGLKLLVRRVDDNRPKR
jgi:membrane-bound ClpP family serine protease